MDKPEIEPLFVEKNNIGVIDIETYKAYDGTKKVYALGFKTHLDDKSTIYYINEFYLDSNKIVLNLVDELLRSK